MTVEQNEQTKREAIEEKITNLCRSAKRYSRYDPRYVKLHGQIDDALGVWETLVCEELLDNDAVVE